MSSPGGNGSPSRERPDLTAAARALIAETVADLTGPAAAQLDVVLAGLSEPLRVAIVGRRNAGKSTIVNALLGERMAPTDLLECTKLVAWYRFDDYKHARIVTKDGSARDIDLLSGGRLPPELGVAEQDIADIEVWLDSGIVRGMTFIDTPGYDALDPQTEARTRDLFERHTVHALVLVLNRNVKADELEALRGFRKRLDTDHGSPVNTIGVVTKADMLDPDDPWSAARNLANANAVRLESVAATVIPVLGLMAETAATERLDGNDAAYLHQLTELPADALWSADSVTDAESDVPVEARRRLLELLGLYGLRYALDQVRSGRKPVPELNAILAGHSGLGPLRGTLESQFSERADVLKAHAAMQELIRLSYSCAEGPDGDRLRRSRDEAYQLMRHPRMHILRELAAYESCAIGDVELPDELMARLRRLACERGLAARLGLPPDSSSAVISKTLLDEGGRWNEFINAAATMAQREVALVVQTSYALAFESLEEQLGSPHD